MKTYLTYIFVIISVFHFSPLESQPVAVNPKTQKNFRKALDLKNSGELEDALEILQKLIKKDPSYIQSYYLASDIYQLQDNTNAQINILKQACQPGMSYEEASLQKLVQLYYLGGDYEEGLAFIHSYPNTKIISSSPVLRDFKTRLEFSLHAMQHPTPTTIFAPDSNLNTPYHDYWPSMGVEENEMVTSILVCDTLANGSTFCQEDIYFSLLKDGKWKPVQPIGTQLNTDLNEGGHCISSNGQYLFFTACNRKNGQGSCDIYYCRKQKGRWSFPKPCMFPVNSKFWDGHPSINGNGSILYFSSERAGGQGGKDLWQVNITYNVDGSLAFNNLKNLGPTINSKGDEISPFMHFDSQTLYYSSNGHIGLGRHDIFKAEKSMQSWSKPKNLGYPINTNNDEIGFIVNAKGDLGWMASERYKQDKDIYSLTLPPKLRPHSVVYYKGTVRDKTTLKPLKAETYWYNFVQNEPFLQVFSDAQTGEFIVCLKNNTNYAVHVKRTGYLFYSQFLGLNHKRSIHKPFTVDIFLEPIKPGNIMVLDNVFFETDSYSLLPNSYPELEQLLLLLTENPQLKIEIRGHTDNIGAEEYNQQLSSQRAEAVYQYLIQKGIKKWRLTFKGYGSTHPIANNTLEEGRAKNRRTEAMIIK